MNKSKSRTSNSLKNSMISIFYNCINILVTFIAQSIFIKTLGSEYNGIKSLFLNILSMLSVVELGFGSAIVYNLYSPIVNDDKTKIKSIMNYYKKIYRIIALIVFLLGMILLPIIPLIVGENTIKDNLYLIFILYLLNSSFSYLLSYKRSILFADQKNYLINIIDIIFIIIKNILQIIVLYVFKNIYLFLVVQIITTMLGNICINLLVNKKYEYLKDMKKTENIDDDVKKDINEKVKGLLFHKIGGFFVTGTDNILISITKGLGIMYVGYYANYNMIISNVALIFSTMINSVTASVGNLLVVSKQKNSKTIQTYKSMMLINSWIYCFGSTSIYVLIEPFIRIWLGNEFILSNFVLFIITINFYLNGIKQTSNTFKEAAGVFYEDRFIPIIESIVNIVFSLIFAHFWGLAGIFIGTICSSLVVLCFSYPKYVYKGILKDKVKNYFKIQFHYLCISIVVFIFTVVLTNYLKNEKLFIEIIIKGIVCCIIPNIIYLILNLKNEDLKYIKKLVKK